MSEQMGWRQAAAARGLKVSDLAEHVGTSIEGIDLGEEHDAEMVAIIRAACVERTLLLFRGQQQLEPAAYLAFACRFGGRPDLHSLRHYCLPDHHEIFVVGNVHEKQASVGSPRVGLNWHTDHYHLPEPGLFTYLHAIQVPVDQGDTRYANGIAAYEALSPALRAANRRHEGTAQPRAAVPQSLSRGKRRGDGSGAAQDSRCRPSAWSARIPSWSAGDCISAANGARASTAWTIRTRRRQLYDELLQHMIQDRFSYRHRWQPGDVLMSDNRCSLHRASEWDEEQRTFAACTASS